MNTKQEMNGVNLEALTESMEQLKDDPSLGHSRFRATNRWLGGARSVNRIEGFYAFKKEMKHPSTFEVVTDEPEIIGGDETEPNPVEYLLASLASCVTASMVTLASVQGIEIEEIESEVEGDIDLNGFAGLQDVPRGFQEIRVKLAVKADADPEILREMAEFSPTLSTLRNGVPVGLEVSNLGSGKRSSSPSPELQPRP